MKTLTCREVAATDQYIMYTVIVPVDTASVVSVIWICVYPAGFDIGIPVDSDTARVQFTRILTFCQCGDTCVYFATVSEFIMWCMLNPLERAVGVSRSYCYTTLSTNITEVTKICIGLLYNV